MNKFPYFAQVYYEYSAESALPLFANFDSLSGQLYVVKFAKNLESFSFNAIGSSVKLEVITLSPSQPESVQWSFIPGNRYSQQLVLNVD